MQRAQGGREVGEGRAGLTLCCLAAGSDPALRAFAGPSLRVAHSFVITVAEIFTVRSVAPSRARWKRERIFRIVSQEQVKKQTGTEHLEYYTTVSKKQGKNI